MLWKKINWRLFLGLLSILLGLCFLGGLYWLRRETDNQGYIAELNGEKIDLNEYKIYLYIQMRRFESLGGEDIWEIDFDGNTAENIAKQNALDNAVKVKISTKEAERLELGLSEEEKAQSRLLAEQIREEDTTAQNFVKKNNISAGEFEKVTDDHTLYTKLYEQVTQNFVPEQEDFQQYFQQYYETNRQALVRVDAQVIWVKLQKTENNRLISLTEEEQAQAFVAAQDIYRRAVTLEEDFETFAEQDNPEVQVSLETIRADAFPEEVVKTAYTLTVGELSPLLTTPRGYYLLRVTDVSEPDLPALEELQLTVYTELKKNEIFDQEYKKWSRNVNVWKNQEVWDEVKIEGLR